MISDMKKEYYEFRKSLGLTQAQMAEKVGVDQRTWSHYEKGQAGPKYKTLEKLINMGFELPGFVSEKRQTENKHFFVKNFLSNFCFCLNSIGEPATFFSEHNGDVVIVRIKEKDINISVAGDSEQQALKDIVCAIAKNWGEVL